MMTDFPMPAGRLITTLILLAAVGTVSACGRRGDLDTPYQAAVDARKEAIDEKQHPVPPQPKPPVKDRPFILDGLID